MSVTGILHYRSAIARYMCNTATHCNALQHTATHCNTLQHTATHCSKEVRQHVCIHQGSMARMNESCHAYTSMTRTNSSRLCHTRTSVLQCVAVCCSVLQCGAVCCSVVQYDAVCCSASHVYRGEELHQHVRCEDSPSEMNQSVLQCVAVCCSVLQCVAVFRGREQFM